MHSEYIEVDQTCCDAVAACRARGGRVIAVGTTAVRSLESAARPSGEPGTEALQRRYRHLSVSGADFHVVDALITNFHLPESTLIMLVSALRVPIPSAMPMHSDRNRYRFFSYGDAMFLTKERST